MNTNLEIQKILAQVNQMGEKDKAAILERIKSILKIETSEHEPSTSLYSLKGVGSELWKDVDIDDYVKKEREW